MQHFLKTWGARPRHYGVIDIGQRGVLIRGKKEILVLQNSNPTDDQGLRDSRDRSQPAFWELIRRPSGSLPLVMSLLALALVLGHVAIFGAVHEADEGTPAHLFHLLILGQAPVSMFFAIKWLPKAPEQSLLVLVLHAGGVVAAFLPVFWFNL